MPMPMHAASGTVGRLPVGMLLAREMVTERRDWRVAAPWGCEIGPALQDVSARASLVFWTLARGTVNMKQQLAQPVQREVQIPAAQATLTGNVIVPAQADGIVLFAHGSGSSRQSPRNVFVATELQRSGLGTLLFDLLTRAEEQTDLYTREHRFDIALLAERLLHATRWIDTQGDLRALRVGYFGAS